MTPDTMEKVVLWFIFACMGLVIMIPIGSAIVSIVILKRAPKWLGKVRREWSKEGDSDEQ